MSKNIRLLLIVGVLFSGSAFAQQGEVIDVDLQEEITRESGDVEQVGETNIAPPNQKIVILNQQPVNQKVEQRTQQGTIARQGLNAQIQQQPITQVEASPLTDSRAAQLRRVRENAELQTEQKIVEKLEQSRLEDEKRRAHALFGNRLDSQPQQQVQQQQYPEIQPAPQIVQVVPVAEQQSNEDVKNEILQEVRNELIADRIVDKVETRKKSSYFSGLLGMTEYEADNVDSNIATGFSVGVADGNFTFEGSFTYSNYYILPTYWYRGQAVYDELDQYNFTGSVKYAFLTGTIRPFVGGIAGYTYRKYTEKNIYADYYWRNGVENTAESDAIDFGFTTGVDIAVSDEFMIGIEYRYMMNMTYKTDSPYLDYSYRSTNIGDPLEEFEYSTFAVVGKVLY